jgi:DNA polymerase-3 subunit epsilon
MMLKRLVQRRRHGKGPYGHLFTAPPGDEVMALDCETTGLNTRTAELVSVAAVPVSAGRVQAGAALDLRMARPASLDGGLYRQPAAGGLVSGFRSGDY